VKDCGTGNICICGSYVLVNWRLEMEKKNWVEEGFVEKSVEMFVRRNGKYLQVVVVGKDGKEKYYLMSEVVEFWEVRKKEIDL
jgi:hypothetical protein